MTMATKGLRHSRTYDIVLFGSTGYTGKLVTKHLAKHAPPNSRIAVAGRSVERMRELLRNTDGTSGWYAGPALVAASVTGCIYCSIDCFCSDVHRIH